MWRFGSVRNTILKPSNFSPMQETITIQPASAANRAAIIDLLLSLSLPVQDLPASLDAFVIAEQDGAIVGVAGLETYGQFGLLRSVAVHPDQRNKQIARKLITAIEDKAKALNLAQVILLTETAKPYFEKAGYAVLQREDVPAPVKQSSEFSHVCPVSAAVMQKTIL